MSEGGDIGRPGDAIRIADFSMSDAAFEYFKSEAFKRKVSLAELMRMTIDVIAADKMVDAIMDDQK